MYYFKKFFRKCLGVGKVRGVLFLHDFLTKKLVKSVFHHEQKKILIFQASALSSQDSGNINILGKEGGKTGGDRQTFR